ncbi:TetR/AcrR family transcriptional regulator C-terminal domain-containing protein [Georgenia satyanarayanai]|uniref:TetR/AcrR family transcriptional regulator C-terminal domain-containing protein n=1 Tax=Georgenia satyanarayanai TaxID=860221 RepID=UPI00203C9049|nr:TetR/AcrR family transcriptional regulator C-terminal domain-containing protein [Georgenia satyanarayanai]MCM3661537.1 TetR/AcrR family transcriptional regulator C-terminal domain-containing protein [Georgenia satyanarayanai]
MGGTADTPRRGNLDRDLVVATAIELVGAEGLNALSMRRLGAAIGVEAMALYRYVDGREDLLESIVEEVTKKVERAADMDIGPHGGWQAYLQHVAHAVRDIASDHPQVFPLVATRHPAAPWLRPPLRNLAVVEDFLRTLTSAGFSEEQAVTAYRAFTSFLLGQLLLTVTQRGAQAATEEVLDEGGATVAHSDISIDDFPTIARLQPKLSIDRSDEEFEEALEQLLTRIDAMVSQ